MHTLIDHLSNLFKEAFLAAGAELSSALITKSERPDLGQFQCNAALAAAKSAGFSPRELAEKVVASLAGKPEFSNLSIAGPGFINISLSNEFLTSWGRLLFEFGPQEKKDEKVLIDFGGPNVAKPLHVGHLRSAVVGDSIRRLYMFLGYDITGDIHLGDWGTQMGMLICEIEREQPELPYFNKNFSGPYPEESPVTVDELQVLYPRASARCKESEEEKAKALAATQELQEGRAGYRALWNHFVTVSLSALRTDFDWLNVHFDWWYGESHYQKRIPEMVSRLKERGQAVESEGALIIRFPEENGKELLPLLLVKSDGASLYATTDLAAIEERVQDDGFDTLLYVVDARQSLHFQQVFTAARQIGITRPETSLKHLGFGTVNGPDGKPFKTRSGDAMKLSDLIMLTEEKARERMKEAGVGSEYPPEEQEEIAKAVAVAALKYADLSNNRMSDYSFDVDKFSRFEGKTGPYLIYTAVRIKSIFRKLDNPQVNPSYLRIHGEPERNLVLALAAFAPAIQRTKELDAPHVLCEYLFELGQAFNRFYQECNISKQENEEIKKAWISLSSLTLKTLETGLDLLGIAVPERM